MGRVFGLVLLYLKKKKIEKWVGTIGFESFVWVPWSLDPLFNRPRGRLVHIVKWSKPTYHIGTRGCHPDERILKRVRMSSHGLALGQLV